MADAIPLVSVQVINNKHIYVEWSVPCSVDYFEIERQVYNSGSWYILESGSWVAAGTADQLTDTYYMDKDVGSDSYQYRVRYYANAAYSDYSYSKTTGISAQLKIGYTFNNYIIPTGEWGVPVTADDIRYTYMFGIDMSAQNGQNFSNSAFDYYINAALEQFETYLGIVIRRRKILTQPASTLTQERYWNANVDYTHEDDPYPFDPDIWRDGYGGMRLNFFPVIEITRAELYTETDALLMDLLDQEWIRLDKASGHVSLFPKTGVEALGPFTQGSAFLRSRYTRGYPHGFKFDYEAGWKNSDFIPNDLREVIAQFATIMALNSVGDGLLAGFSSSSISLDGLSESFSSTQSATSSYFGARILSYTKHITEWLKLNKYKYNMPLAFV